MKYRPSNGTEGMAFIERFCDRCAEGVRSLDGEGDGCPILIASMIFNVDEPGYPEAWAYDENGDPTCTEFRKPLTEEEQWAQRHAQKEARGQQVLF